MTTPHAACRRVQADRLRRATHRKPHGDTRRVFRGAPDVAPSAVPIDDPLVDGQPDPSPLQAGLQVAARDDVRQADRGDRTPDSRADGRHHLLVPNQRHTQRTDHSLAVPLADHSQLRPRAHAAGIVASKHGQDRRDIGPSRSAADPLLTRRYRSGAGSASVRVPAQPLLVAGEGDSRPGHRAQSPARRSNLQACGLPDACTIHRQLLRTDARTPGL